jgi:flavin reductase (DIM6/NTAB) family NADH-FMN oxidoreductase RutF
MKKEASTNSYINPEPYTIVSCRNKNGKDNALAVGFAANVSFEPRIIMIAIIDERYSHHIIKETGEFVVNIATKDFQKEMEYLGSVSGKYEDKLANINTQEASVVNAPILVDCPVNFECTVIETVKPGTHDVFFGKVEKVHCDEEYLNNDGSINWNKLDVLHS